MPRQTITRRASDNEYLHKDFHGALSAGIDYLDQRYGEQAVRDYLRQFALAFYAPLREALRRRGLEVLREHFERLYAAEDGQVRVRATDDELVLEVAACPAVTHMRERGYAVARLFHETTKAVNEAICEGSDFAAELVEYDPQTGRSVQRFHRRTP